jgi:hypothetical protein
MIAVISALLPVICAAGAAFYRSLEVLPFALWAFLASVVSVAKVLVVEDTVNKVSAIADQKEGKRFAHRRYFFRMFLTAAVLAPAALVANGTYSALWGAVAGVLTFQIAAMSLRFFKLDEDPADSPINSGGD